MRRFQVLVVLTAAAGALAGAANPSHGVSLPAGEIMFPRSDVHSNQRSDLYVARPDGSHLRLLVRNGAGAAASPDGRLIAFVRDGAIWVMNRDTSGQRAVTKPVTRPIPKGQSPGASDYDPAWSRDGGAIYFARDVAKTETASLYRVKPDGAGLRRLTFPKPTDDGHCHDTPSPSPDGRLIAFADWPACHHGTSSSIEAITPTGRPARLPFRFPSEYFDVVADPAWAPSGKMLAYTTMDLESGSTEQLYPPQALWVSPSDGSAARRILDTKRYWIGSPAWSPDSEWIVFDRARNDNYDIWRVHWDGSHLQQVTKGNPDDRGPSWLPAAP